VVSTRRPSTTSRAGSSRFRDAAAAVELDGKSLPAFPLRRGVAAGAVGLGVGPFAAGRFSNFAFGEGGVDPIELPDPPPAPVGVIRSWSISDTFAESDLDSGRAFDGRTWTQLGSEPSGLTDLARVATLGEVKNTVFAKTTLVSGREGTVRLDFGFSDRVRVYLNRRPLFTASDGYSSAERATILRPRQESAKGSGHGC
jgi:hypothetical protein